MHLLSTYATTANVLVNCSVLYGITQWNKKTLLQYSHCSKYMRQAHHSCNNNFLEAFSYSFTYGDNHHRWFLRNFFFYSRQENSFWQWAPRHLSGAPLGSCPSLLRLLALCVLTWTSLRCNIEKLNAGMWSGVHTWAWHFFRWITQLGSSRSVLPLAHRQ